MKRIFLMLTLLSLAACQSSNKSEANNQSGSAKVEESYQAVTLDLDEIKSPQDAPQVAKVSFPPPVPKMDAERKMVYSSDIKYQVLNVKESDSQVLSQVKKAGGYITQKNESHTNGNLQIYYAIRIPANVFDTLMTNLGSDAIFTDYKNISSEDLTEEYTDNDLRLKSKKKVHERYLELLKQAKNVTEVMTVEEQIRQIQEEVDVNAGRNKTIDKQVAFSTISLTIYQKLAQSAQQDLPFFTKIYISLKSGFSQTIDCLIDFISNWPLILISILGFYFGRKWWRKRKQSSN